MKRKDIIIEKMIGAPDWFEAGMKLEVRDHSDEPWQGPFTIVWFNQNRDNYHGLRLPFLESNGLPWAQARIPEVKIEAEDADGD